MSSSGLNGQILLTPAPAPASMEGLSACSLFEQQPQPFCALSAGLHGIFDRLNRRL